MALQSLPVVTERVGLCNDDKAQAYYLIVRLHTLRCLVGIVLLEPNEPKIYCGDGMRAAR